MLAYPIKIEPDGDTFLVTCPDLPEVTTFGDDQTECLNNAQLATEESLASRLAAFEDIPKPGDGKIKVAPGLVFQIKVLLFWSLKTQNMTRADLQRATGWHRPQVDRLFDANHNTRLDQFDIAFKALGRSLDINAG